MHRIDRQTMNAADAEYQEILTDFREGRRRSAKELQRALASAGKTMEQFKSDLEAGDIRIR